MNTITKKNLENLKKGECVFYTYGDNNLPTFDTKAEAEAARQEAFGELYTSKAEMDRLLPIQLYIFIGDTPIERLEDRLNK